jgi:putative FmdB family regulatory protein
MPQYVYKCKSCDKQWEEFHSLNEAPSKCPFCEMNNFHRVPSYVASVAKMQEENKIKTGEIVKDYIEQNKQVLKELKQEIKSKQL